MTQNPKFSSLQKDLCESIKEHKVPGASIAVLNEGEIYQAAAGVLNQTTGVSVTPNSLFHIGSISKLFTATQIMQLVEHGDIDLDKPFNTYVPEFSLKQKQAAQTITTRNMLTHTSGIPGDFFEDTGPGENNLEKYTQACHELTPVFAANEHFSYCNTGYSLLGYQITKLTGKSWEAALASTLMKPLGAKHWAVRPERELHFSSAVGHMTDPATGKNSLVPLGPRSMGPGGSRIALSPWELLRFAQMHMNNGRAENGSKILSQNTVLAMQEPQIDLSFNRRFEAWGLGWMLFGYGGKHVIGHDGGTAGMTSQLRLIPDQGFAIAVMSNGGNGGGVFRDIAGKILAERGAPLPEPAQASGDTQLPLDKYAGRYRRHGMQIDVEVKAGQLIALVTAMDGEINVPAPTQVTLAPVDRKLFLVAIPGMSAPMEVYFVDFDKSGCPQYLYSLERALKRLG